MGTRLAEPVVLAAAKETLYPDVDDTEHTYTVTDTQFATNDWHGWQIPDDVRTRLQPMNPVRLESGEPDLLGVGTPAGNILNDDAATTPVVAVEAKGNRENAEADIKKGIEQAHSRLSEVNAGFVAAPATTVTETARAFARDLNIGIIGVESSGDGVFVEPARVVGAGDFSTEIDAIRFQASTHHLTDGSFPVNHPKNYLGYALAVAADGPTDELYSDYVISQVTGGRRGAQLLELVEVRPNGTHLTQRGAEVARIASQWHGSPEAALREFDAWWGSSTRFIELAPEWAQLARSVVMQYPPAQLIVESLEGLHSDGVRPVTLQYLVEEAFELNRTLAIETFFAQGQRETVLTRDGDLNTDGLRDPAVYKSGSYFQFKAQLFHVGLITDRGTDDGWEALYDEWALEEPVR